MSLELGGLLSHMIEHCNGINGVTERILNHRYKRISFVLTKS